MQEQGHQNYASMHPLIRPAIAEARQRPKARYGSLRLLPVILLILAFASAGSLKAAHHAAAEAARANAYVVPDGPFAVETISGLVLHDVHRGKDLPLRISYPGAAKRFPVIIFSHGAGGSKDGYHPLIRCWTSHGYVCLQPSHADSIALAKQRGEPVGLGQTVRKALVDSAGWQDRAKDISFIIDSLDEIVKRVPQLKGKLDQKRIGVGGHSYGAFTALAIGGATVQLPGDEKPRSLKDTRVCAILVLSGQGHGQMGLTERSWGALGLPMMTMTGSLDRGARGQGPEWRMEPFRFSPRGDKYHVFIEGATHFSFSGPLVAGRRWAWPSGADDKAILSYIKLASLKFWQAYLEGDSGAKAFLGSDALQRDSGGAVKLYRR